jgi:uncharacterized protein VirK/YbjX
MTGRDNSFTVNIIPHDANRRRRQWKFSGRKLIVFRLIIVLLALVVASSVVIITLGTGELSRNAQLKSHNHALRDSLDEAMEMNERLEAIELELEHIRETRLVIENLATAGVSDPE